MSANSSLVVRSARAKLVMSSLLLIGVGTAISARAADDEAAAASAGKSRAQVHAELVQAERDGNVFGPRGVTMRDIYPSLYRSATPGTGLTRDEVRAELEAAERNGEVFGPRAVTMRDEYPSRYPATAAAGKTRAEVKEEQTEAIQAGETIRSEYPN